ncbi:hypothetical protein AKO1_007560 [Acrasis kona]|uniref:Sugar phosphate transporter domain-containing protein n=1 Tax=Acrasis kona TaxID=1008807 RepID=A0AAW2YRN2_9EUKA
MSAQEQKQFASQALIWFAVQGISSISLTILNKSLAFYYPFPAMIIAIQNLFSIPLFVAAGYSNILPMNQIQLQHLLYSLPTTLCYVLLLWTSIEGLSAVSIALVVIMRNLVPFATGAIENIFFDLKLTGRSYISLAAIFVGAVFYSLTDFTLSYRGITWLLLNTFLSVLIPIVEKRYLTSKLKDQTPAGINFYRNTLSVPMLLVIAYLQGNLGESYETYFTLSNSTHLMVLVSCLAGFSIGIAYYFLLKIVSNTSIAIANTFYKLTTLAASTLFWGIEFDSIGIIGILVSFGGILSYTTEPRKPATSAPPATVTESSDKKMEEVLVDIEALQSDEEKRQK